MSTTHDAPVGHLVTARREGESLRFGPFPDGSYIHVEVLEIRGRAECVQAHHHPRVRLAIRAPKSVGIVRGELAEAMRQESGRQESGRQESGRGPASRGGG